MSNIPAGFLTAAWASIAVFLNLRALAQLTERATELGHEITLMVLSRKALTELHAEVNSLL